MVSYLGLCKYYLLAGNCKPLALRGKNINGYTVHFFKDSLYFGLDLRVLYKRDYVKQIIKISLQIITN